MCCSFARLGGIVQVTLHKHRITFALCILHLLLHRVSTMLSRHAIWGVRKKSNSCCFQTALERQDLSRMYLVHHELESVIIIIVKQLLYSCHYHGLPLLQI